MKEPRIQYARTSDGVSIAFYRVGQGMPLVLTPGLPAYHLQLAWRVPSERRFLEGLAQKRMVVRYDPRGSGLSDRDVEDISLDAYVLDLEAVVDDLGFERFALSSFGQGGPVAIAYATRHPERVSHLILHHTFARSSDGRMRDLRGLGRLLHTNWELFTETFAHARGGWSDAETGRGWARMIREAMTQEAYVKAWEANSRFDVTELLPDIRSPTMVLQKTEVSAPSVDVAKRLAASIPGARLVLLSGSEPLLSVGDTEAVLAAIDDFLSEGEEATPVPLAREDVHTILMTDMEGSTALTQQLGDAEAQEVLRTHNAIIRDALKAHSGSETRHTGDGIMASFASASKALEAAISMQRAFAQHNESNPDTPIRVRIGLNAGEPVAEDKDLFGTAVQLAARICDQAAPGQILVSDVVQQLAAGKGFTFTDKGAATLKGFEKPVRLHEVVWD